MKNKLSIWLVFIFAAGPAPAQAQEVINHTQQQTLEERLHFHGFEDAEAMKRFMLQLKNAADSKDKKVLTGLVRYPFSTYNEGVVVKTYKDQNELLENFDTVFSERVIEAISKSTYESLFVRDQGAMIGNGEVWLSHYDEGIQIKAIN